MAVGDTDLGLRAATDMTSHVNPVRHARVGRETQRYDGDTRLLACAVIVRPGREGAPRGGEMTGDHALPRQVLLISSSKHADEWILPKGGWESDESLVDCVVREANEEAGAPLQYAWATLYARRVALSNMDSLMQIDGRVERELGCMDFVTRKGEAHRLYGFELACEREYSEWAEQSRQRAWVSFPEAYVLLSGRPEFLEFLRRVDDTDAAYSRK